MYESFFNLTAKPFDLLPNPDFLFLSKSHKKALMYLEYGILERAGFILLTGGIGSGKTTIIRDLVKKKESRVVLSKIFNTKVSFEQLLTMINDDFGLSSQGKDKISLLRELNEFLIDQFAKGNQAILIIDEAQNLSVELLEEVRMLSNLETDQAKLLQIILVGQPELRETLALPALMQLRQRININCNLLPLTAAETMQYILHRLEKAGNREAVHFSREAMETIFAYSRGVPRLINIICDFLMLAAFAEETRRIGRAMVRDIIGELNFENHFWGGNAPVFEENEGNEDSFPVQEDVSADQGIAIDLGKIDNGATLLATEPQISRMDAFQKITAKVDSPDNSSLRIPPLGTGSYPSDTDNGSPSHSVSEKQETPTETRGKAGKGSLIRRVFGFTWLMIIAAFCVLFSNTLAGAAEFAFHPSLAVGEEYTDNVFETSANKRGDYITRLLPGATLKYQAPFWDWDINYTFDYRYYARGSRNDDTTHNLGAKGLVQLIDKFMFLELNDTYSRVSLDVSRDTSQESLFNNQSDHNTFNASPYLLWRLGTLATLKTGYRYINTWYRSPTAVDKRDHSGYAELSHEFSTKASVSAGYSFTHQDTSINDNDKHNAYAGGRYEYAEKSFIFGQAGNTWIRYSNGTRFSNLFWNAGITHDFDGTVASLKTDVSYPEDPLGKTTQQTTYSADVSRRLERGNVGLNVSYAEFEDTLIKRLQTRRYGGTVRSSYELLPALTGTLSFTAEKYERKDLGSYTRKYFVDSGLSYLFAEGLTVALNYKYIDYESPGIAADNNQVNRASLEVRKVF